MIKVLCLVLAASLCTVLCPAQTYIGIQGSIQLSNMPGQPSGGPSGILSYQKEIATRFSGGLWADLRISDYMNFQPHLLLVQSGVRLWDSAGQTKDGHIYLSYLQTPALLMYRIPLGYDDLFLGGGPYAALGLNGTYRSSAQEGNTGKVSFDGSGSSSNDNLHLRPYDFGYMASISYQCSFGLTFSLYYNRGIINLNAGGTGATQNQSAGFTLGYLFHYNTRD